MNNEDYLYVDKENRLKENDKTNKDKCKENRLKDDIKND